MIVYLDASALLKRYVAEHGSREIAEPTARADAVALTTYAPEQGPPKANPQVAY